MSRWSIPTALGCALFTAQASAVEVSPRIIDGSDASPSDWNYIAALVYKNQDAYEGQFCGGSLIKDRYVLTAAHCVDDLKKAGLDAIVGINDLNNSASEGTRVSVKSIFVHPSYDSVSLNNDIAVLELSRAISTNEASPVSIATAATRDATADGTSLKVAGWGSTTPEYGNPTSPTILQELTVPLVNQQTCSQAMSGVASYTSSPSFCAGTQNEGYDSCRGDSGGPIVVENTGVQLGLVSWGNTRCGEQGSYGVYTNLSQYRSWIDEKTLGLSFVQYEDKGYLDLGTYSHTFEFTNYSNDSFSFGIPPSLNSSTAENVRVTSNSCDTGTLAVNQSCSITISYELTRYGATAFTMNLSYYQNGYISENLMIGVEAAVPGDVSLASNLNLSGISVYTDDNPWTINGSNGVRSATIDHSEQSTLILDGISAGVYEFDVRLATEAYADVLYLYINGESQGSGVSGERSFTHEVTLPFESNAIKFIYQKDHSIDTGEDAAFVSNFRQVSNTSSTDGSGGGGSLGWISMMLLLVCVRRR